MLGFNFHETMSGTWTRGTEERALRFSLDARVSDVTRFLRDRRAHAEGHVDANGLATHAPLVGFLVIDPLLGGRIAYDFTFTGDDGKAYRFTGEKGVTPLRPLRSMTTLPGTITNGDGAQIGSALVHFDVRDLIAFLRTFRLTT